MPIAVVIAFLALVFLLLALIPARRLWKMGVPLWPRIIYLVTIVSLGIVAFEIRPLARFLLPLLIFLFLLPFSSLGRYWDRWRRWSSRDDGTPSGSSGAGSRPGGAAGAGPGSRQSRGSRAEGGRDTESVIDGTAVRLDPEDPKQG
jgi:uncharacterized membrane protein YgcG